MVRGMRITLGSQPGSLPYSLPGPGEAVQISTNTPEVATPPSYSYAEWHLANFGAYGSGDFNADYSEYGAYCFGICGGEGLGNNNNPGILAFDFSTAEWEGRSLAVGGYDYYGDFTVAETNGYPLLEANTIGVSPSLSSGIPVPGHAYHCNVILPASLGGGSMGSMISSTRSACCVESVFSSARHRLDIASMEYTLLGVGRNVGGSAGNMSNGTSVLDRERGRILHRNGDDGSQDFEYLDVNELGSPGPIKYLPSQPGFVPTGSSFGSMFMYEGYIIKMGTNGTSAAESPSPYAKLFLYDQDSPENTNAGWVTLNFEGSQALANENGNAVWQWVESKGMFYKLPRNGGTTLWTLTPPSLATIKTGAWTLGTKTIESVPSCGFVGSGSDGVWHAFFYIEALGCFGWIPAKDNADGTVYLIGVPD
jgi:hypothetical protein